MSTAIRRAARPGGSMAESVRAMPVICHETAERSERSKPSTPRAAIFAAPAETAPRTCGTPGIGGGARPRAVSARTDLRRQSLQRGDAILGGGMGREQVVHPLAGQRIDDEEVRGRRRALRAGVLDRLR